MTSINTQIKEQERKVENEKDRLNRLYQQGIIELMMKIGLKEDEVLVINQGRAKKIWKKWPYGIGYCQSDDEDSIEYNGHNYLIQMYSAASPYDSTMVCYPIEVDLFAIEIDRLQYTYLRREYRGKFPIEVRKRSDVMANTK